MGVSVTLEPLTLMLPKSEAEAEAEAEVEVEVEVGSGVAVAVSSDALDSLWGDDDWSRMPVPASGVVWEEDEDGVAAAVAVGFRVCTSTTRGVLSVVAS